MLRDVSHRQEAHKFSFIESLNSSRKKSPNSTVDSDPFGKLNADKNLELQQNEPDNRTMSAKTSERTSAIVATSNTSATISADWYQVNSSGYGLSLAEIINSASDNSTKSNLSKKHSYLGKVLFALAFSYCLFVFWWLFGHQANRVLTMLTGGKHLVLSKSDVQFIDYMERSLDNIDRQVEAKKKAAKDEVVYVPVYTPAPATQQIPLASPSISLPAVPPSQPVPPPLEIPAPPPLPAPTPVQNQVAIASKPAVPHTLIGVLELGEGQSAALVKIQGKTRRVWLGEEINTEGWILESIGNQRANISYQGQVRSISVGETF